MSTRKRLDWVRKNFSEEVWARLTVMVFHPDLVHRLRASSPHGPLATILDEAEELYPTLPGRSRYDKHLRWIAGRLDAAIRYPSRAYQMGLIRLRLTDIIDWVEAHPGVDLLPMSLDEAVSRAWEWHRVLAEEAANKALIEPPPAGPVIHQCPPYTIQRLSTAAQLDGEGLHMGHCVRTYRPRVDRGEIEIWSVRDEKGFPHATVEINLVDGKPVSVQQARGKSNSVPGKVYGGCIIEHLEMIGIPKAAWGEAILKLPDKDLVQAWREGVSIPWREAPDDSVLKALQNFNLFIGRNEGVRVHVKGGRIWVFIALTYDWISVLGNDDVFERAMREEGLWERYCAARSALYPDGDDGILYERFAAQVLDRTDKSHHIGMPTTILTRSTSFEAPTYRSVAQMVRDLTQVRDDILLFERNLHLFVQSQIGGSDREILPAHRPRLHEVMDLVEWWAR